jgi:hypothetical protein
MRVRLAVALAIVAALPAAAVLPVTADAAQGTATATAAAKKHKRTTARCLYAQVQGKRTCLRVGAVCRRSLRATYLLSGLDCVRRRGRYVFAKASPAAARMGRYMALSPSGELTFQQALAAFDQTVADLPGVDPPPGTVGETSSATGAIAALYDYRDRLTQAQLEVLDAAITPPPGAMYIDIDSEGNVVNAPPPATAATLRRRARSAQALTPAQLEPFRQTINEAVARLKAHGVILRHGVSVWAAPPKGGVNANAWPLWLSPHSEDPTITGTACAVRIFPAAATSGIAYVRQVLLHELTHCAQFEFLSSIGQLASVPKWVGDGIAEYFAYTISKEWSGTDPIRTAWILWQRSPQIGLFSRWYDGVGWWFLLAQQGANIASLLGPAEQAGSNEAAFAIGDGAVGAGERSDWGSTAAQFTSLGSRWALTAPGVPQPPLPGVGVSPGTPFSAQFQAKGAAVAALNLAGDVVHVETSPGVVGHLRDANGGEHDLAPALDFCLRQGQCSCPDEQGIETKLPPGPAFVGAGNTSAGGFVTVTSEKLEDACKKQPARNTGGGGGGGAGPGGLQIRALSDNAEVLGTITTGTCSFTGGAFVARGAGSGWRFSMRVAGARSPGRYDIPNNDAATYVKVSKGGQTFSTIGRNTEVLGVNGPRTAGLALVTARRVKVGKRTVTRYVLSVGIDDLVTGGHPGVSMIPGPGALKC